MITALEKSIYLSDRTGESLESLTFTVCGVLLLFCVLNVLSVQGFSSAQCSFHCPLLLFNWAAADSTFAAALSSPFFFSLLAMLHWWCLLQPLQLLLLMMMMVVVVMVLFLLPAQTLNTFSPVLSSQLSGTLSWRVWHTVSSVSVFFSLSICSATWSDY